VIRGVAVAVGVVLTVVVVMVGGLWLFQRALVYVPSPGPVQPPCIGRLMATTPLTVRIDLDPP